MVVKYISQISWSKKWTVIDGKAYQRAQVVIITNLPNNKKQSQTKHLHSIQIDSLAKEGIKIPS